MSVTGTSTNGWVSVEEAARLARVSARTVQRWITAGDVVSDMSDDGRRRVRCESLPLSDTSSHTLNTPTDSSDASVGQPSVMSDAVAGNVSDTVECPTDNPASHEVSPDAATWRAEAAERERNLLKTHVETLTRQLEARTQAEEQLRVMLVRLEQTNSQLAAALVQKALPPPPVEPKKVRWWWPWRR
jgi:hypothetical protein